MTWMNAQQSPLDVQILNELLTRLQLPHVPAVDNPPMSDAAVCWESLQVTWREFLSRGWYCCNRRDRVTPSINGTARFVPGAVRIQTSECLPGDPPWERIVGRPLNINSRLDMTLFKVKDGSPNWAAGEEIPLVDAMMFVPIGDAPMELSTLAVEMTAAKIAGSFGVALPGGSAMIALQNLNRLEAEMRPNDNTNYDSAETARLWMR